MNHLRMRALCEGAVMVALATALSFVSLGKLPNGGSFDLAMLPIFFFCARWGWKESFVVSVAYGLLQIVADSAYAWGPWSLLLDFLLAYGILGVASFFRKMKGGVFVGTAVACLCRFLVHFVSGVTIYRIYAPTEIFSTTIANPWLYSALYNGSYVGVDMVLCLAVFAVLYAPLKKYLTGADLTAGR